MKDYRYITAEEFIEAVESAEMWDDFEAEAYAYHLEEVGLDYHSYDDPDEMWNDYLEAVRDWKADY